MSIMPFHTIITLYTIEAYSYFPSARAAAYFIYKLNYIWLVISFHLIYDEQ